MRRTTSLTSWFRGSPRPHATCDDVAAAPARLGLHRTAAQTLAEAARDAGDTQGVFDAIQPPDRRSDQSRSQLDDLLQPAVSTLEDLRTAARRGDVESMAGSPRRWRSWPANSRDFDEAHR